MEDLSEALGAEYRGTRLGNTGGDFAVYSFYPNRHLTTLEGSAIAFRSNEDFERCRWLRRYGIHVPSFRTQNGEINPASDIAEAGWNTCMNQVTALVGVEQFNSLEQRLATNRSNGEFYDEFLSDLPSVRVLDRTGASRSAYWVYTLLAANRDELSQHLTTHGIQNSRVHLRNDFYSCFGSGAADLPGVREFSSQAISIPCGWWVTPEQRMQIAELIAGFPGSHV